MDRRPGLSGEAPIRVMVVDDSIVARTVIARLIEADQTLALVAVAQSADSALAMLADHPVDVIVLDVQMPGTDGLTALPMLIERSGGAKILVVSSSCGDGAAASVRALTLGAADTMLKPTTANLSGRFAEMLIERLVRIGRAGRRREHAALGPMRLAVDDPPRAPLACLAIGASTGGPHALAELLKGIPADFPAPILITQHLPASFIPYFADQLHDITGRTTRVARHGAALRDGEIMLAPGDAHLRCVRRFGGVHVALDSHRAPSGCMPSVDPMMESVGEVFGAGALGVMLTGMGRDGVAGARALVAAGGEIYAQDEQSSVVWGMPGAVAEAGLASAVLPPARIARRIAMHAGVPAWK